MANKSDCWMGGSSQCCNCTVITLFNELAGHSKHICYNTAYSVDLYKREGSWCAHKTVANVGGGGDCHLTDHHSDINIYGCLCVYWWILRQREMSLQHDDKQRIKVTMLLGAVLGFRKYFSVLPMNAQGSVYKPPTFWSLNNSCAFKARTILNLCGTPGT